MPVAAREHYAPRGALCGVDQIRLGATLGGKRQDQRRRVDSSGGVDNTRGARFTHRWTPLEVRCTTLPRVKRPETLRLRQQRRCGESERARLCRDIVGPYLQRNEARFELGLSPLASDPAVQHPDTAPIRAPLSVIHKVQACAEVSRSGGAGAVLERPRPVASQRSNWEHQTTPTCANLHDPETRMVAVLLFFALLPLPLHSGRGVAVALILSEAVQPPWINASCPAPIRANGVHGVRQLAHDALLAPIHHDRTETTAAAEVAPRVENDKPPVSILGPTQPLQHCALLPIPSARRREEVPPRRRHVRVEDADRHGVFRSNAATVEVRAMRKYVLAIRAARRLVKIAEKVVARLGCEPTPPHAAAGVTPARCLAARRRVVARARDHCAPRTALIRHSECPPPRPPGGNDEERCFEDAAAR